MGRTFPEEGDQIDRATRRVAVMSNDRRKEERGIVFRVIQRRGHFNLRLYLAFLVNTRLERK